MANLAVNHAQKHKVLSIQSLVKSFDGLDILKSVSVDMNEGDFLVLVGPSGCGKSTLLNCIAGLEDVTGGNIFIDDRDVTLVPPRDRDIAMVFQSYALYPTMTVGENIAFGMKIRKIAKDVQDRSVLEVAKMLQIDHLLDRKPSQLSGGQRQRVAMGRALVRKPVLFLFDEPLSNLDAKLRVEMRAEIHQLHKQTHASIVYVTHDQIEAMTLGSKIVVMKDGYIQQVGSPKEIYDAPANTFVANFMGTPPMNLVTAKVEADAQNGLAKLVVGDDVQGFEFVDAKNYDLLKPYIGKEIIVGIRAENFAPFNESSSLPSLSLPVRHIESSGSDTYVSLTCGDAKINARLDGRTEVSEDHDLALNIDIQYVCYFDKDTEILVR